MGTLGAVLWGTGMGWEGRGCEGYDSEEIGEREEGCRAASPLVEGRRERWVAGYLRSGREAGVLHAWAQGPEPMPFKCSGLTLLPVRPPMP